MKLADLRWLTSYLQVCNEIGCLITLYTRWGNLKFNFFTAGDWEPCGEDKFYSKVKLYDMEWDGLDFSSLRCEAPADQVLTLPMQIPPEPMT